MKAELLGEAEKGFSYAQTIAQFCQPGCEPRRTASACERESYDIMLALYGAARENLAAAYNNIVAGYRTARQCGRV